MEKLSKYGSDGMEKGLSPRTPDLQSVVTLHTDTFNLTQGMEAGLTVRQGFSPIPGQGDNETSTLTPRLPGLRMSEGSPATGLVTRLKVLGWVQLALPDPADVTKNLTVYGAVVTSTSSGSEYLDIALCSTWISASSVEQVSANIYDGFGMASFTAAVTSNTPYSFLAEGIVTVAGSKANTIKSYLLWDATKYQASIATINVSGGNIPMAWLLGSRTTFPDATHAPSCGFFRVSLKGPGTGSTLKVNCCGIPSEYQLQNFKTAQRSMKIYALTDEGALNIVYAALVTPTTTTFQKDYLEAGHVNLELAAVTATKVTSGTSYSSTTGVLVNDPACTSNSSYTAMAVAAGKPYVALFQGAFRCDVGKFDQWFDLSQNVWQPPILNSSYQEDFNPKSTCFATWEYYTTGDPMLGIIVPQGPVLLGADTGVLRKKTVYEFTYSLYNKRLNFETNVGIPVKFLTSDTLDNVGLQLWWAFADGATNYSQYYFWRNGSSGSHWMPYHFGDFQDNLTSWYDPLLAINFCEYRFYYRQLGTFEWLPAGRIDAAQFWNDPYLQLNVCTGDIAATPGGQPGSVFDYSPLPADTYNCVVQYKNRFFWFSEKACVFSLPNNIFAYPATCSISASTGKFLGAIVHNYPGQAEQSSRLVIFGTTGNYVARFTGNPQLQTVQISSTASADYPIQGSDLVIDPWTSVTAFSYQTAVIADGILYYWGPQGVYRDDGVATPTKISGELEPYIFTLYDPNKVGEMHGHYDDLSKEITWFYTPKVSSGYSTHTLVYNVMSQTFLPGKIPGKVDWVQSLNIESNIGTAGKRSLAGVRASAAATVQRSYFYDNRNRSGDMYPTRDWFIKTIATPVAGVRRLTLAAGYDATNFATIVAGDYLALQQTKQYDSSLTLTSDLIATIKAVSTGSGYIDIYLPTGATLDTAASPTYDKYFPFWQRSTTGGGNNGIDYELITDYWAPAGINGYFFWLYWYLLAKMTLWKSDLGLGWKLGYRTPTADARLIDQVAFADNSDGSFQVYHPLAPGNDNHEGQGLQLSVIGTGVQSHIGNEWVLQYMEIHGIPRPGDMLKRFEG